MTGELAKVLDIVEAQERDHSLTVAEIDRECDRSYVLGYMQAWREWSAHAADKIPAEALSWLEDRRVLVQQRHQQ